MLGEYAHEEYEVRRTALYLAQAFALSRGLLGSIDKTKYCAVKDIYCNGFAVFLEAILGLDETSLQAWEDFS